MAHQRKIIRHAIVALLTDATSAAGRVEATRVDPNKKGQLPAIGVYSSSEDSEANGTEPRELAREVKIQIAGWVAEGAEKADDLMDDLAEQIESAMDADRYLGGAAAESVLVSTSTEVSGEGDPKVGVIVMTYSVTYYTVAATGGVSDEFLRADVTTQVGGAGVDNAAHDVIEVREP